jgi:hypothetical protein
MKKIIIIAFSSLILTSCNFFKTITTTAPVNASHVKALQQKSKYLIIKDSTRAYEMRNATVSTDGHSISCELTSVSDEHNKYLWNDTYRKTNYRKSKSAGLEGAWVLKEAHFTVESLDSTRFGNYSLPLSAIKKIEVMEKDQKKTTTNHIIVGILVAAGAAALAAGIAWGMYAAAISAL